jgi:hypothetical protein
MELSLLGLDSVQAYLISYLITGLVAGCHLQGKQTSYAIGFSVLMLIACSRTTMDTRDAYDVGGPSQSKFPQR